MPHCFKADASDGFHVERAPNKALASAQSVHSIAAQEHLKILCLVPTVALSAWKSCRSMLCGCIFFFFTEEIKNCKEPSGQKWPMQWWKHSSGRYICQRRKIVNLVTLMSHLVYRRFSSLVESAGEPAPQRQAPLGWSALSASSTFVFIPAFLPHPHSQNFIFSCFCQYPTTDKSDPVGCHIYWFTTDVAKGLSSWGRSSKGRDC